MRCTLSHSVPRTPQCGVLKSKLKAVQCAACLLNVVPCMVVKYYKECPSGQAQAVSTHYALNGSSINFRSQQYTPCPTPAMAVSSSLSDKSTLGGVLFVVTDCCYRFHNWVVDTLARRPASAPARMRASWLSTLLLPVCAGSTARCVCGPAAAVSTTMHRQRPPDIVAQSGSTGTAGPGGGAKAEAHTL